MPKSLRPALMLSAAALAALGFAGLRLGTAEAASQIAELPAGAFSRLNVELRGDVAWLRAQAEEAKVQAKIAAATPLADAPDLTQTSSELPGGGDAYCGPVAISNALVWLARHGYSKLLPAAGTSTQTQDASEQQLELVKLLGSNRYMSTSTLGGTGTSGILNGLSRYLEHNGYAYQRLAYQGWRGHPFRFSTRQKFPRPEFITRALEQGGVAVIHAGWYKPSKYADAYRRNGGHWLTVVGAGVNSRGRANANVLVLHDPAPYADSAPAKVFVELKQLESGWLMAENGAFPAAGYYQLAGEMHVKREGDVAIMDGAIALVP